MRNKLSRRVCREIFSFLLSVIYYLLFAYCLYAEELKLPPLPSFSEPAPKRALEKPAERRETITPQKKESQYRIVPVTMPEIPGMVYIPAGEFIIGTDQGFKYESPARKLTLGGFYIDRYEVTNTQYKRFVDSTGHTPPVHWRDGVYSRGEENFPVSNISYYDALAFAKWSGKRLPSEEEWEKAARGDDGRLYPWGNEWKKKAANVRPLIGFGGLMPAGSYREGSSPYGCFDLAGNVWEWTTSWFQPYPGNVSDDSNFGEKYKVIRGGSYRQSEIIAQCPRRDFMDPEQIRIDVGFRCAR